MPRETQALTALAFILVVTATWWALALWPLPADAPEWIAAVRYTCFGALDNGLPHGGGWLLLVAQPISMAAVVLVLWGRSTWDGLARVAAAPLGRIGLALTTLAVAGGLMATTARVATAARLASLSLFEVDDGATPDTYPRLDRPAPELGLVDQFGATVSLASLAGRPALVTYAFGHCVTVCPIVVRDVLEAQHRLAGAMNVTVVVVSLDPWRDLPSRLPAIAEQWHLGQRAHALSGDRDAVHRVLREWGVPWERDTASGDITHPRLVHVLDAEGTIVYATSGGVQQIVTLATRVGP
jgi:cytochrome oxidase Cu insertion factor (SCO1/SenC/PrrC family)